MLKVVMKTAWSFPSLQGDHTRPRGKKKRSAVAHEQGARIPRNFVNHDPILASEHPSACALVLPSATRYSEGLLPAQSYNIAWHWSMRTLYSRIHSSPACGKGR